MKVGKKLPEALVSDLFGPPIADNPSLFDNQSFERIHFLPWHLTQFITDCIIAECLLFLTAKTKEELHAAYQPGIQNVDNTSTTWNILLCELLHDTSIPKCSLKSLTAFEKSQSE